jgi:hypothetical protein
VACSFLSSEMASSEEYKHSFRRWVAYRWGDKIETRLQRGKSLGNPLKDMSMAFILLRLSN